MKKFKLLRLIMALILCCSVLGASPIAYAEDVSSRYVEVYDARITLSSFLSNVEIKTRINVANTDTSSIVDIAVYESDDGGSVAKVATLSGGDSGRNMSISNSYRGIKGNHYKATARIIVYAGNGNYIETVTVNSNTILL